MQQPHTLAQTVSSYRGTTTAKEALVSRMAANLGTAHSQNHNFEAAEVVLIVADCPDVRVNWRAVRPVQEWLTGVWQRKTACVGLHSLAAGVPTRALVALRQDLNRDGKVAVVLSLPHTINRYTCGCGAVKAVMEGLDLPGPLSEALARSVIGRGTDQHVRGLVQQLRHAELDGVVALVSHLDRTIMHCEVAGDDSLSQALATALQQDDSERRTLLRDIFKPDRVDVAHQQADLALVDLGGDLLPFGGASQLISTTADWGEAFTTSTLNAIADEMHDAIFSQMYPLIAKAHGDFRELQTLAIFGPATLHEEFIPAAVERMRESMPPDVAFYSNVLLVDGPALAGLCRTAPTMLPPSPIDRTAAARTEENH